MLLLSFATLYIMDNEVGYNLYVEEDTGRYYFKPTVYENRNIYPPSFWAHRNGSNWEFEGLINKDIQDQAIEEISYYLDFRSNEATIPENG